MAHKKPKSSFEQSPPSEGWPQDGVGRSPILTCIDAIPIKRKQFLYLPANKELRHKARGLRKMGNKPEIVISIPKKRWKLY